MAPRLRCDGGVMIIGPTARNVTIVCNLLAFPRKDQMVASGYCINAMKQSILSTDGILFISWHVHQGHRCIGPVCERLGDKYVLMTSITRKHSTGNTNTTTIKMSTINQTRDTPMRPSMLESQFMHVCHM